MSAAVGSPAVRDGVRGLPERLGVPCDALSHAPAVPTESLRLAAADLRRVYAALPNPGFRADAEGVLSFTPL